MLSRRGEPLFIAAWHRVLMIHLEVDADSLQHDVPFQLDLYHGRAFVTLVSFTMQGLKPRYGGRWTAQLFKPIATHDFLNVRTYVHHGGEPGIHFLAEWLSNRLAVRLGPATFGLPYRHGKIAYDLNWERLPMQGCVTDVKTGMGLVYHGSTIPSPRFQPCDEESQTEWLMERYTAFNSAGGHRRFFRVWHPPWPQCAAQVALDDTSLLTKNWPRFSDTRLAGANYSPGFDTVWMGRPHRSI